VQRSKELRRTMTPQEKALWERWRNNQLDGLHFRRQQIIAGFIADFYCSAPRVVIELDGMIHRHQADYDRERDKVIAAHNLTVVRLTNDDIESDLDRVLTRLSEICRTRRQD
jgi:very-short-patch-repair endonuclease